MKQRMYKQFYKARKNETFMVFAITFAAVALYSTWGAYMMHAKEVAVSVSPQVATAAR